MNERLTRGVPAMLAGVLVLGAAAGALGGTESAPAAAGPADIELRKSFRSMRRESRQGARPEPRSGAGEDPGAPEDTGGALPSPLGAVAEALGEHLESSGTLHLPEVGGGRVVLQGSLTPILETATGRRLIIDRERTIDPATADGISRRWPDFTVVQPPAGAGVHDLLGSVLDASGYASVLRSVPLILGRETTIRVTPDFVVLRNERDLLEGETRAISVVDPADALPAELRELAGEHRVRIVELDPDGAPAGVDRPPWRDPEGKVTTMEAARLSPVIEEIAGALGLSVERRAPLPDPTGGPGIAADLRVSFGANAALVFEKAGSGSRELPFDPGETTVLLHSPADLPAAIGTLLKRFSLPAIGPTVEFYRALTPGSTRRFVISVPGWLSESGGRRLLITGAAPPPLVRLYLTREGIDIFEYRIRDVR